MDLEPIIDEIASQADDFLADVTSRREAQAGIAELINADYARLTLTDRKRVMDAVITILDKEDFFNGRPAYAAPDPRDDDGDADVAP